MSDSNVVFAVPFEGGERARLGIATFDSAVQFYALRPGQSAPQMLVVPDTAEPYAPSAGSLLVNAHKARSLVSARADPLTQLCCTAHAPSSGWPCAVRYILDRLCHAQEIN